MENFCKTLPKIELHAHLNGSLSLETLQELRNLKKNDETRDSLLDFRIEKGHSKTLAECFAIFKIAHALTDTADAVKLAVLRTLKEFSDDGVAYLELRSTPRNNPQMTKFQYVQAMVDAVIESSKVLPMKTCLLISIDRRIPVEEAQETMNVAIEMSKKYPSIIVGLDISGDPTAKMFKEFSKIFDEGRKAGLKVSVHAAETSNSEEETLDILKWKPERLGHVTYNSEHTSASQHLWNTILDSKIPIELCLTSNVKSGTVKSYEDHHFKAFYDAGHPISIATDDKGVFDVNLSDEFFICAKTFDLNKEQLWTLSYKAVDQIFADEQIKNELYSKLAKFKDNNYNGI